MPVIGLFCSAVFAKDGVSYVPSAVRITDGSCPTDVRSRQRIVSALPFVGATPAVVVVSDAETDLLRAFPHTLHIAPEVCLMRHLKRHFADRPEQYVTADLRVRWPTCISTCRGHSVGE